MRSTLQIAGARHSLCKQSDDGWTPTDYALTGASFLPGIGNVVMVGQGMHDAYKSYQEGDTAGVIGGLAGAGVGAILAGEGGKPVQLGVKAGLKGLKAAGGVRGLWGGIKRFGHGAERAIQPYAAKALGAVHGAVNKISPRLARWGTGAARWIRKNPVKSYLAATLIPSLFGGGGGSAGSGNGRMQPIGVQSKDPVISNVAPKAQFMPMPSPSATGRQFQEQFVGGA